MKYLLVIFLVLTAVLCFTQTYVFEGEHEIYRTSNGLIHNRIYQNHQVPDSWNQIGSLYSASSTYLWIYDKINGLLEIRNLSHVTIDVEAVPTDISIVRAVDIDDDGSDELFCYSPGPVFGDANSKGVGRFFSFDLSSGLELELTHSTYRNFWKEVVVHDFDQDGEDELLFFDPTDTYKPFNGIDYDNTALYDIDANGILTLINDFEWPFYTELFQPIDFANSTGILVSNGAELELYKYDSGTFNLVTTLIYSDINQISVGNYDGSGNQDIFIYNRSAGVGSFYEILQNNQFNHLETFNTFRSTWESIFSYNDPNYNTDNLVFYQREFEMEICIPTYENSKQVVHPDILERSDGSVRMAFTPYPNTMASFENPSILESGDGINFNSISGAHPNPLATQPVYTGYNSVPYGKQHNDDPDYFFEGNSEYVIYQETMNKQINGDRVIDENVVIMVSEDDWSTFDTSHILIERNNLSPYSITASPTLIKKGGLYYLFYVNAQFNDGEPVGSSIQYITSTNILNWQFTSPVANGTSISFNVNPTLGAWHLDIIYNQFFDNYYMLLTAKTGIFNSGGNSLYIARSEDLLTWDLHPVPIITKNDVQGAAQIYRSTGRFRDFNILDIYYSYPNTDMTWHVNLWKNINISDLFPYQGIPLNLQEGLISQETRIEKQNPVGKVEKLNVFPNPVGSMLNLNWEDGWKGTCIVNIINSAGQILISDQKVGSEGMIDVSRLQDGLYFVEAIRGQKASGSVRFIKGAVHK